MHYSFLLFTLVTDCYILCSQFLTLLLFLSEIYIYKLFTACLCNLHACPSQVGSRVWGEPSKCKLILDHNGRGGWEYTNEQMRVSTNGDILIISNSFHAKIKIIIIIITVKCKWCPGQRHLSTAANSTSREGCMSSCPDRRGACVHKYQWVRPDTQITPISNLDHYHCIEIPVQERVWFPSSLLIPASRELRWATSASRSHTGHDLVLPPISFPAPVAIGNSEPDSLRCSRLREHRFLRQGVTSLSVHFPTPAHVTFPDSSSTRPKSKQGREWGREWGSKGVSRMPR